MPNTDMYNAKREKVGQVELPGALFEARINPTVLHEVTTIAQSNQRTGTRSHKTRGAVSGGGRKPWKQKGTGRARQGSTRSPQWRTGGTVFGPLPKDYDVRPSRKKRRAAIQAALTWKFQNGYVHVVDEFPAGNGKTKFLAGWLAEAGWRDGGVVLVHTVAGDLLPRAGRNLRDVKVERPDGVNLYDLVVHRHLVLTRSALTTLEELWAK